MRLYFGQPGFELSSCGGLYHGIDSRQICLLIKFLMNFTDWNTVKDKKLK